MKHRDDARDPADEGHVVLDHHHRRPRIQFQDQLRHAHGFLVAHASRRLVEQNHLGFARHHHADLHPLALAVGQLAHQPAGDGAQPQPRLQLLRPVPGRAGTAGAPGRQPQVLVHRQAVQHGGHLVLDAHAPLRDGMRLRATDAATIEQDVTLRRRHLTAEQLEEGALARAVRPDQAAQFASPQGEVDIAQRPDAAEALAHATRFENDVWLRHQSLPSRRRGCSRPGRLLHAGTSPAETAARRESI